MRREDPPQKQGTNLIEHSAWHIIVLKNMLNRFKYVDIKSLY